MKDAFHADSALPAATVSPAHALQWLAAGWRLFRRAPLQWLLQALISTAILAALGMLPLLGSAAAVVAMPLLLAGMLSGAQALERGQPLQLAHLAAGLRLNTAKLLLLGLFYLLGALLAALLAAAIGGSALFTGMAIGALPGATVAMTGAMLAGLVFSLLWVLLLMAMWYAPALVMLHHLPPLEAMRHSVRACLHNMLTFIVLAALLYVLGWLALIPAGLGMLVLLPVIAGTLLAAWQDTFAAPPHLADADAGAGNNAF